MVLFIKNCVCEGFVAKPLTPLPNDEKDVRASACEYQGW